MNSFKIAGKYSPAFLFYRLKILTFRLLKGIHNLFYKIGIDISLRKKKVLSNAIEINSIGEINKFYSSSEVQFEISSDKHQVFFLEIIKILEARGVKLRDKKVADFGCGIGNLLFHIDQNLKPSTCYGFDFSETLLELAVKRFPHAHFELHDIYMERKDQFDFVFCTEVIEHLLYPGRALQNVLSVVRKSAGGAFITVPDGRIDTFEGHINFWSPESWEIFIKEIAGEKARMETGYVTQNNLYALILFE